jgi:hypothetical protein
MTNDSRASEHARILADIASQVVAQYSKAPGAFTTNPEDGHVPVPEQANPFGFDHSKCNGFGHDPGWDWTLAERYRP